MQSPDLHVLPSMEHLLFPSPHSVISINNVSFSLLSFEPNSSSLTLSLLYFYCNSKNSHCQQLLPFLFLPTPLISLVHHLNSLNLTVLACPLFDLARLQIYQIVAIVHGNAISSRTQFNSSMVVHLIIFDRNKAANLTF